MKAICFGFGIGLAIFIVLAIYVIAQNFFAVYRLM
jgi:hypothetical protein